MKEWKKKEQKQVGVVFFVLTWPYQGQVEKTLAHVKFDVNKIAIEIPASETFGTATPFDAGESDSSPAPRGNCINVVILMIQSPYSSNR